MKLPLTRDSIEAALPRIERGLAAYLTLQRQLDNTNVYTDAGFRRKFNGFYRVRRNQVWQESFYEVMELSKGRPVRFRTILDELHRRTGRFEASFASKLAATLDPSLPVIDSVVLGNVGLRLPSPKSADRAILTERVHEELRNGYTAFLETPVGRHLLEAFDRRYPGSGVTAVKKLDLVLWQTR